MSRTVIRVLSLSMLGMTALVFALWWSYVRAPVPERVCERIVGVSLQDASDRGLSVDSRAKMAEMIGKRCQKLELDRIQLRGRLVYAEHAKCVMAASSLAEINRC
jgi:hypothetical protein